ncbi:MAG TPA: VOC family protein [Pyrinomonadaceae bacterium]|jgi:uncharacterized glyoxalase superfamily protein PhnB|nr:VOC family protein [Pyrinomonadaceae bacterium]
MKRIKLLVLLVHDQQEAFDFYTEKLGFRTHTDAAFGEGNRWLTICLPEQPDVEIALSLAANDDMKARVGNQLDADNALFGIATEDIKADIAALKAKGVEMASDLIEQPYGKFVFFKDLYGNKLYLSEEK